MSPFHVPLYQRSQAGRQSLDVVPGHVHPVQFLDKRLASAGALRGSKDQHPTLPNWAVTEWCLGCRPCMALAEVSHCSLGKGKMRVRVDEQLLQHWKPLEEGGRHVPDGVAANLQRSQCTTATSRQQG
eukprot:NODE_937_length_1107_cov_108.617347_g894_i0.p1 GENE.NODE_937_length_1107_cov_108.617347_g894_i0~~NODE_937_length_1107_cov_108.617347_g894_i0.p1  ORF type:complete len:128 (-),score=5.27 NODE_937_length_1107_cov_108.617347_g894_i0:563-946(-)